jgi:pimeloyl-ACP methyl ester carboxylesterase
MMWRTVPRRIALILAVVLGIGGLLTAPAPGAGGQPPSAIDASIAKVSAMSAKEADAYLDAHPREQLDILNSQPEAVADYWQTSTKAEQKDAIRTVPQLIGNLDGVDYTSRDKANRRQLTISMRATDKALKRNPNNEKAQKTKKALMAITGTLAGKRSPKRYLTMLTDDAPPLAAVAIGNLDTAKQVTFNVPGMGTYSDDMQLWTQSAQNVYDMQGFVGATGNRSVVAWIGYVTPPPGIEAAFGRYAADGAPRLEGEINGFWAAHDADDTDGGADPTVNIVAHSYGTTTAANALADQDLSIRSFVMLGSAGIESRIRSASALHAKFVYAGEASDDMEARWGRVTRTDPRSPSFGARVLDVDGKSNGLLAVTGHTPIVHSKYNDNPLSAVWKGIKNVKEAAARYRQHLKTYGYFDVGTESLENVAVVTTPRANIKAYSVH